MRALVVYESMFGNTRAIAEAIGAGLASAGATVEVVEVGATPSAPEPLADLVVVGGPTHAFGMSRSTTRASAGEQAHGPLVSTGAGVREWLTTLPAASGTRAAAFDTRVDEPWVPGSAARAIQRRLRGSGHRIALPAEGFLVAGVDGPLVEGEVERAHAWGARLAAAGDRPTAGAV